VNTSAARYQQLSLNPLKLAGQCGKLKCCLNYELDSYIDALKEFPEMDGKKLLTKKGDAFLQKTDIFRRIMWFSYRGEPGVLIPLTVESVHKILEANTNGETPEELIPAVKVVEKVIVVEDTFDNLVGQDSLTRFDRRGNKNKGTSARKNSGRTPTTGARQKPGANQNKPEQTIQKEINSNKIPDGQKKPQQKQNQPNRQNQQGNRPQKPANQNAGGQNQNSNQNRPQNKPNNRPQNKPNGPQNKPGGQRPDRRGNNPQPGKPNAENEKKDDGPKQD